MWRELGLDRYPELRDDYFGNYTRVIWLAQRPTPATRAAAAARGARLGLPLVVREAGTRGSSPSWSGWSRLGRRPRRANLLTPAAR